MQSINVLKAFPGLANKGIIHIYRISSAIVLSKNTKYFSFNFIFFYFVYKPVTASSWYRLDLRRS